VAIRKGDLRDLLFESIVFVIVVSDTTHSEDRPALKLPRSFADLQALK